MMVVLKSSIVALIPKPMSGKKRKVKLTYPIKQHLIAQAKELGFDTEKLIHVPQTSEIINYKAGPHVK